MSYYKLGNKVLFMINDSKSAESFFYRASPSWSRNPLIGGGVTKQTYIWTETMNEVRQKTQVKQNWIQNVRSTRDAFRSSETQRLPIVKF